MLHETSQYCGKPPGRPPNPNLVRDVSHHDKPFIDPEGMGALEDPDTMLRVLGRLKEDEDILPLSSLATLTSHTALRGNVAGLEDDTIMG